MTEDIERLVSHACPPPSRRISNGAAKARAACSLLLFRVDGAVSRIAVGTSRPLREPALIGRLFHERLAALEGDIDAGYGFDLVRLAVLSTARIEDAQTDLAGDTIDAGEDLALFADRVRARLGDNAVLSAGAWSRATSPSGRSSLVPFAETAWMAKGRTAGCRRVAAWPERPVRLFRDPEPVEVTRRGARRAAGPFPLAARPAPRRRCGRARAHRAGMVARQGGRSDARLFPRRG